MLSLKLKQATNYTAALTAFIVSFEVCTILFYVFNIFFYLLVCKQEGKQASLAADFSITQFKHIGRLLMVHGRNSYKRSAALGQFVMHRGMIISTMQVQS